MVEPLSFSMTLEFGTMTSTGGSMSTRRPLGDLRVSLGLPESSQWTRPPDGRECFHMTVGNTKHDRR